MCMSPIPTPISTPTLRDLGWTQLASSIPLSWSQAGAWSQLRKL